MNSFDRFIFKSICTILLIVLWKEVSLKCGRKTNIKKSVWYYSLRLLIIPLIYDIIHYYPANTHSIQIPCQGLLREQHSAIPSEVIY